ncbi:hypothetical protein [Natrinema soli]|uniref:Uncharacterized protein n=1 Tax=Natrinema soli TaxID=1930624 RepID=A0ABD5SS16_9EURY|nr:hypothetical protein [Natrinema soli]
MARRCSDRRVASSEQFDADPVGREIVSDGFGVGLEMTGRVTDSLERKPLT